MPFTQSIDPVLLHLGPLQIRYYGLVYALGFLTAFFLLEHYRKQGKLHPLTKEDLYDLLFYLMVGVILGGRLFHIFFWNPSYYLQNPLDIFAVWKGGMAFHGGLLGAILAAWYFSKKKNFSFWKLADILVIPAALFLALGRVANFINNELYGPLTNIPWCVYFPGVDGCRHPYQLYAAAKRFLVFLFLLYLSRKEWKEGFIFWNFVLFTGIGRFILDFWREDLLYLGLSLGQWYSLPMVLFSIYFLSTRYGKNCKQAICGIFHP